MFWLIIASCLLFSVCCLLFVVHLKLEYCDQHRRNRIIIVLVNYSLLFAVFCLLSVVHLKHFLAL